jgi:IMP dehydrogenase
MSDIQVSQQVDDSDIDCDDISDGSTIDNLFRQTTESLTYDDIILLPRKITSTVNEISLKTQFTKNISLHLPLASSPMDTVTESEMAIELALQGGIGIIHCNNSIDSQVNEVMKVKRYINGFIANPIVVKPTDTVQSVLELKEKWKFSGFPVTTNGNLNEPLIGMVSNNDIAFIEDTSIKIETIMRKRDMLIVAQRYCSLDNAFEIIKQEKINRLPIVDENNNLVGLICRKDLRGKRTFPLASKDKTGKLLVGAAVTTHPGDRIRIDKLVEAGVDVICIDSSNGCSDFQIETLRYIKDHHAKVDVIAGNVVTRQQARWLLDAGADAIRIGQGAGTICITQDVLGVGRAQASAVYHVSQIANLYNVPTIADGGIYKSGQIAKALVFGACSVMMGSMFAGTDEAPGEVIIKDGVRLKMYRGQGSVACYREAKTAISARYLTQKDKTFVAQGVVGYVPSKGAIRDQVPLLAESVKHTFQHLGLKNMKELWSLRNKIRVEKRSFQAQKEGTVHNLYSYEK